MSNSKRTSKARTRAKKVAAVELGAEAATLAATTLGAASGVLPVAALPIVSGMVSSLAARYLSLPINKDTKPVDSVSDTWKGRPKANLVKWLMQQSDTSLDTIASYLGCSTNYLNNKLSRDSFSFDDLILVAYACGYTFVLVGNNEEVGSHNSYRVDLLNFFEENDPDSLSRISKLEAEKQQAIRKEYEEKKAELERMKAAYGFED